MFFMVLYFVLLFVSHCHRVLMCVRTSILSHVHCAVLHSRLRLWLLPPKEWVSIYVVPSSEWSFTFLVIDF